MKARERLSAQVTSVMNAQELDELARDVGLAAVKFADLKSHRLSGVVFDVEELVSFEGCNGPYVQYACVQIWPGSRASDIVAAACRIIATTNSQRTHLLKLKNVQQSVQQVCLYAS